MKSHLFSCFGYKSECSILTVNIHPWDIQLEAVQRLYSFYCTSLMQTLSCLGSDTWKKIMCRHQSCQQDCAHPFLCPLTLACRDKLLTRVEYHQVWRWESHESSPLTWFHVSPPFPPSCIHTITVFAWVCMCACAGLHKQGSKSHFPRCPECSFSAPRDVIVTLGDKGK